MIFVLKAYPTSEAMSSKVISCLNDLFSRWGLSKTIISDSGPQSISSEFVNYLSNRGIQQARTASYHPQANGAFQPSAKGGVESSFVARLLISRRIEEDTV